GCCQFKMPTKQQKTKNKKVALQTKSPHVKKKMMDSSEKRNERGGRSEQRTEYVKPRQESQRSLAVSVKKEEKPIQSKQQFKKKKVAAFSVRHATQEESSLEEQDMGTSTARQRGRGHNSSPESSRAS
ncbi:hypothetical protein NDU88_007303, partial [Pleurodeles waltl]